LRIAAETDNSATTLACVQAGLGIGIIAGNMRGYLTKGLPCRSLTKEMGQVQIVAAYRAGRQLSSPALEFLELLGRSQEL
jgi:DNA-binding transcriptional LysR family regulator